jgi:hypothetical protein
LEVIVPKIVNADVTTAKLLQSDAFAVAIVYFGAVNAMCLANGRAHTSKANTLL